MYGSITADFQDILSWWIGYHTGGAAFNYNQLPITIQEDIFVWSFGLECPSVSSATWKISAVGCEAGK